MVVHQGERDTKEAKQGRMGKRIVTPRVERVSPVCGRRCSLPSEDGAREHRAVWFGPRWGRIRSLSVSLCVSARGCKGAKQRK